MKIRTSSKLNKELRKVVSSYNAKISRLQKQGKTNIPEKATVKAIKEDANKRNDITREINRMKRFLQKGSEKIDKRFKRKTGQELTIYEVDELKRNITTTKRNLTREIKEMEQNLVKVGGKEQAGTFAQMGDERYLSLLATRKSLEQNIEKLNEKEFKRLVGRVHSQMTYTKKQNQFKEYYIESLLGNFAYYYGADNKKMKVIKDKLMQLNPSQMTKLYKEDKIISTLLDYIASPKTSKMQDLGYLNDLIEENRNEALDIFDELYENIDEIIADYL